MMTATATPTRAELLDALRAFICQRPGFEWQNYAGAPDAYRADLREAANQRADALQLLAAVEARPSITADDILAALSNARRLSWDAERGELEYTTGQYFPTEYRRAAASALASILWHYWGEGITEGRKLVHGDNAPATADEIRAAAARAFAGRRLRAYFR